MRSRVEIVADVTDVGRPVLVRMRADGQFAVRRTGPVRVHLVGTAAGPLGGDDVEVRVVVREGACLEVRGVAASLALPSREGRVGEVVTLLDVAHGGVLVHAPGPLIVCRAARVRTRTEVALTGTGQADVEEQVVLGRHGEPGGAWSGLLRAERDGRPLVRTTQDGSLVAAATVPPDDRPARALVTRLRTADGAGSAATSGGAVCCPLVGGGVLISALGPDLPTALADAGTFSTQGAPAASRSVDENPHVRPRGG